ncbi:hypothetical protein KPL71_015668 [Citrus sinensis]|uniref:Uncharacterized protein n=1 Tax=Citrus sinensis TaxID=2711 RepID=A0ACB8KKY8_CITSI|nr:hypothetical protein KPL71_015668 [Citrus sinensis]
MGDDHALEIAGIVTIKIKMFDGTIRTIGEEADACVASNGEESTMMWHLKLGHMSKQDLIHFDIWESPDISMGDAKYMVTFIDDYSRRCWVYSIKKKSDVFSVFKEYKAHVKLEYGKRIKCLRTDNSGEYTDGKFLAFWKQEGIQRQFTVAYTPQQNGVAEQMNRTEQIRAMLRTAGLPNLLWAEAAKTVSYIVNRSPSTAIGLKIVVEMWTGKPADYSYLHAFGCLVYVMYNAQERTKLNAKSRRCIFLGYADGVKGYRLWDLTAHKIVISRDVIFIEDQLQKRDEDDSSVKEKSEIIPVYVENNPEDSDSSEAAPEHEEQKPVESEAPEVHRSTRERRPPTKAIGNKWVYKIKRDGNDQVERYRARFVVKGYAQKEGIDFNEIFSPVVRLTTVRVVLAMCATFDLHLEQLDVKTAFLHGELEEKIYMLQPEGFAETRKENLAYRLNKYLYGLKQAPRCWYKRFDSFIMSLGYNRLSSDHCAYYKRNNRKIWLSQKNYLKKILRRFNMHDCKPISTPLPVNFKLSSNMCPSNEAERKEMSRVPYASAVGSLMFTMICTRPDIAQAVGAVSRYMTNPLGEHWIAVKRILGYIKGTSDVALCYGGSEFTVKGYVDSDFAGDLDKMKSTTGYMFSLAGGATQSTTVKQDMRYYPRIQARSPLSYDHHVQASTFENSDKVANELKEEKQQAFRSDTSRRSSAKSSPINYKFNC